MPNYRLARWSKGGTVRNLELKAPNDLEMALRILDPDLIGIRAFIEQECEERPVDRDNLWILHANPRREDVLYLPVKNGKFNVPRSVRIRFLDRYQNLIGKEVKVKAGPEQDPILLCLAHDRPPKTRRIVVQESDFYHTYIRIG